MFHILGSVIPLEVFKKFKVNSRILSISEFCPFEISGFWNSNSSKFRTSEPPVLYYTILSKCFQNMSYWYTFYLGGRFTNRRTLVHLNRCFPSFGDDVSKTTFRNSDFSKFWHSGIPSFFKFRHFKIQEIRFLKLVLSTLPTFRKHKNWHSDSGIRISIAELLHLHFSYFAT